MRFVFSSLEGNNTKQKALHCLLTSGLAWYKDTDHSEKVRETEESESPFLQFPYLMQFSFLLLIFSEDLDQVRICLCCCGLLKSIE